MYIIHVLSFVSHSFSLSPSPSDQGQYPEEPEQELYDDVQEVQQAAAEEPAYEQEPDQPTYDDIGGVGEEPDQPMYDDVQGMAEPDQPLYDDAESAAAGGGEVDVSTTTEHTMSCML